MEPLLSVVTVTYNHEPFIAKCIEGVLMQQVSFPIEFIIGEDCSTDRTRAICRQYAEKYPETIKFVVSEKNVGGLANERRAMSAARGKYVAYCEGDDYWTDPLKLQKQVGFLETHPEYSACFHRFRQFNARNNEFFEDGCGEVFEMGQEIVEVTEEMFFNKWITQPLTMVYRSECLPVSLYDKYKNYKDTFQIYELLQHGKIALFSFEGGIRNLHNDSMHGGISLRKDCEYQIKDNHELYSYYKSDKILKNHYLGVLQWSIASYIDNGWDRKRAMELVWRHFVVSKSVKGLVKNLKKACSMKLFRKINRM